MANILLFDEINNVPVTKQVSAKKLPGDLAMWIFHYYGAHCFCNIFHCFCCYAADTK